MGKEVGEEMAENLRSSDPLSSETRKQERGKHDKNCNYFEKSGVHKKQFNLT